MTFQADFSLATQLDFTPDPQHQMFRDSVAAFFAEHLPEERIRALDEARDIPADIWQAAADQGWFGLTIPEKWGGTGADETFGVVLIEEVARRFPSMTVIMVANFMAARAVREHGTEAQKNELLPKMARGDYQIAFGITEPDGGTDALRGRTRAEKQPDGSWRVNGSKLYTTNALKAQAVLTLARTGDVVPGKPARGLSLVLVPTDQPGVTVHKLHLMGMRAACTCSTFFDNAEGQELLGEEGRGFYHLLATLAEERILAAASYVGIMQGTLDAVLHYAQERQAFGRPIGAFQAVQHPIAEIAIELEAARLATMKAAWRLSKGEDSALEATMVKVFASEASARATDKAMRVLAGYGLVQEQPVERLFRDARLGLFSPVSNEMALNFIGERLGLARSY